MAIKKICNKSGCNALVDAGVRFCDKHIEQEQVNKKERNKHYDMYRRDEKSKAFYISKEWKALRTIVRARFRGLCSACLKVKRIRAGYICDHIIPIKVRWELRLEESNLQYLCIECHNTKTAEDKRRYGI
ncbi:HNH endonuclease [Paenibacillus sp. Root444D2]|uniref:HNH endonuclease n=1 Tax=Paenibacillus sp. Root444D2 TaxID=1736538 RepID=UPI000709D718|nr:HNH endonuclease [Paenibacillus sp. Root444D2]KQX69241.1 hypothetical protein ASD40_01705 [Paenibacillus sp. Root444D2]